jgi:hypothetical protein
MLRADYEGYDPRDAPTTGYRVTRYAFRHEVAVKTTSEVTGEELKARIRELDRQVRPMLDLKPVTHLRGT